MTDQKTPDRPQENIAEPSWLVLREGADHVARENAGSVLDELARWLGSGVAHGVDIGTGTGSNHRYLGAQLGRRGVRTVWTVADHDRGLLNDAAHGDAHRVHTDIAGLAGALTDTDPSFLTCAAVLDVLTVADLRELAALLEKLRIPALFSLSVTGAVHFDPSRHDDALISDDFNAHQRRGDRAGPSAPTVLTGFLPGWQLRTANTAWRLDATTHHDLLARYLRERVQAATQHNPDLAGTAADWLRERRTQLSTGRLRVVVDHVDQLILPGVPAAPAE